MAKYISRKRFSRILWFLTILILVTGWIMVELDRKNWAMYLWITDPFYAGMAVSTLPVFYRNIANITFGSVLLIVFLVLAFSIGVVESIAFFLMALPFVLIAVAGYTAGFFLLKRLERK